MSPQNLFRIAYYFDSNTDSIFPGMVAVLIGLVLIIIVSLIVSRKLAKWSHFKKEVASRLTRAGSLVGWVGLLWLLCRYEGVPYLAWRAWPALLAIYLAIELVYLGVFVKVDYPKQRKRQVVHKDKDLYLRRFLGR
ncbi:MAG: hypothetical protein V1826_00680 [bacterium]